MNQNLIRRILTALVALAIIIPLLLWSPIGLWLFCAAVSGLALWEFFQLTDMAQARYRLPAIALCLGASSLFLGEILSQSPVGNHWYGIFILSYFPLLALITLYDSKEANPVQRLGTVVLGPIYCFIPLWLLFRLASPEAGGNYDETLALGILILVWVLDVMAYFAGRFLGKHPLFPRISPKKTWEGAIGGTVCCLLAGWALETYLPASPQNWVVLAMIIALISQLGDLVESMFKRSLSIKDSGSILPGHGGMLDRFDGLFLVMPFIYLYFSFL